MTVYRPLHVRNRRRLNLTDHSELCKYFHHVTECPELNMNASCMCVAECRRKSVGCVVQYRAQGTLRFDDTYVNIRSGSICTHVEQSIIHDDALRTAVQAHPGGELTMWITFQPCHYSGGRPHRPDKTSCTYALLHFHACFPSRHNVHLTIRVANLHRALVAVEETVQYADHIRNAQQGIQLLKTFCTVSAFTLSDWLFLESLFGCHSVTEDHRTKRRLSDMFTQRYIESVRCEVARMAFKTDV